MDDATHAVMPPDPEMIQVGDAISTPPTPRWMTHCHNLYHAPQGGMTAMLSYQT